MHWRATAAAAGRHTAGGWFRGGCLPEGWHNHMDMEALLDPLLPLYERERSFGRSLALGLLAQTEGSTYRKPGALMLIAANGEYAGLLSGGCLEGDLREIGFVFQEGALFDSMTVEENVAYRLREEHVPEEGIQPRVREALR